LQARGRVLKIEDLEMPTLIDSAVEMLQDTAMKRQIAIHTDLSPDLPVLAVDLRSTVQCLTNILGNAIKYSPDGSEIFIEAEVSGDFVHIRVRDEGVGIPEAELPSVIEPFHRAGNVMNTTTQGAGLGLSITENLMHRQHGYLEISSSPDEGTMVTLGFPIAPPLDGGPCGEEMAGPVPVPGDELEQKDSCIASIPDAAKQEQK
jgi:signal transduction histidine kinase